MHVAGEVVADVARLQVVAPSGLSKLNFRMSRFGDSHGCCVKTEAIAKTAQSSKSNF